MKKSDEKISGGHAIMECLIAEGVDLIFGYPGGAIMPTYDALYDYREKIRHILVRHEQGASHAAEGYARVTGKAGVCLVTSGPGATNLVTGIADAMLDSVPLVCITGQVSAKFLGTDAFQETDIISVTMPITKWNYQITSAKEIPEVFAKAFYIANSGRPGPVLIDITKNAQVEMIDFTYKRCERIEGYTPVRLIPNESQFQKAAKLINSASKPYLVIGHGVLISKAQEEVRAFVEKTGIPVASTLLGLSAFPTDHQLYVGMLGMHGNYGPNLLTNEADLIIAIGMRFDDRVTGDLGSYATKAKIIHVDIDAAELEKNVKTEVPIAADARVALQALIPLVENKTHPAWLAEFKRCHDEEYEKVIKGELYRSEGKITMGEAVRVLSEKTAGQAIVVADVGQHQMMAARYYKFQQPDSYIASGGLGTMGFALPAAIGAKLGAPEREVVAIIGDGGFQMTLQELGTAAQEDCGVKIVILNNNFLGMVRQWQEMFFDNRYSFVELKNPDFIVLSSAFGIPAERVTERSQLEKAVQKMLQTKGPYLLEILVENEQNVFPMVPSGSSVSQIRLE
jgi:acetolactate synthase-1/2/3 large subunit